MLDIIIGLFLRILLEALIAAIAEGMVALGFEPIKNSFLNRREANPFLAAVGLVIVGGFLGLLVSWIFPNRILPAPAIPYLSLLFAPIIVGYLMKGLGNWRERKGKQRSYIETFWGGAITAYAASAVRLLIIT